MSNPGLSRPWRQDIANKEIWRWLDTYFTGDEFEKWQYAITIDILAKMMKREQPPTL